MLSAHTVKVMKKKRPYTYLICIFQSLNNNIKELYQYDTVHLGFCKPIDWRFFFLEMMKFICISSSTASRIFTRFFFAAWWMYENWLSLISETFRFFSLRDDLNLFSFFFDFVACQILLTISHRVISKVVDRNF